MQDFGSSIVKLIDFGISRTFREQGSRDHRAMINENTFEGNTKFSSVNQMNFLSKISLLKLTAPSRRDDLISLSYLLINLKHGYLPWDDLV